MISKLYLLLFTSVPANADKAGLAWERDLGQTLTEDEWEHINLLAHSASKDVTVQENCYKICTHW